MAENLNPPKTFADWASLKGVATQKFVREVKAELKEEIAGSSSASEESVAQVQEQVTEVQSQVSGLSEDLSTLSNKVAVLEDTYIPESDHGVFAKIEDLANLVSSENLEEKLGVLNEVDTQVLQRLADLEEADTGLATKAELQALANSIPPIDDVDGLATDAEVSEAIATAKTEVLTAVEEEYVKTADLPTDHVTTAALAEAIESLATKADYVKTDLSGSKGLAKIFNEEDGGGAQFRNNNGIWSFVGVNDGAAEAPNIAGQLYVVDKNNGNKGVRLNMTPNGFYYTNGATSGAQFTANDELATKADIAAATPDVSGFATKTEVEEAVAPLATADSLSAVSDRVATLEAIDHDALVADLAKQADLDQEVSDREALADRVSAVETSYDAAKLTGTIDIARLPAAAVPSLVVAESLTEVADVQNGDVVQIDDKFYYVVDDTKLGSEAAFKEFTPAILWDAINDKPNFAELYQAKGNYATDVDVAHLADVDTAETNARTAQDAILAGRIDSAEEAIALKANASDVATAVETLEAADDALTDEIARVEGLIPTVPTNVSAFTNDSGYLTEHQDISDLATKTEVQAVDAKFADYTLTADLPDVDAKIADAINAQDFSAFAVKTEVAADVAAVDAKIDQEALNRAADIEAVNNSQIAASRLTGIISISNLPKTALSELKVVATVAAMQALTTNDVQAGDTVKVEETGKLYYVVEENDAFTFVEYTASTDWASVANAPTNVSGFANDAEYVTPTVLASELEPYAKTAELPTKLSEFTNDVQFVPKELIGTNGKALIFNEADGGGAKFENNNGVHSFVGVNDSAAVSTGLAGQLYVVDKNDNNFGTRLNLTKNGFFYNKGTNSPDLSADKELVNLGILNYKVNAILTDSENLTTPNPYARMSDLPVVPTLATVATSGSYNDLADKPTIPSITGLATEQFVTDAIDAIVIPTVPTNVSEFTNDAGYLTAHQDISNLATKAEVQDVDDKVEALEIPAKVSDLVQDIAYLTEHQDLSGILARLSALEAKIDQLERSSVMSTQAVDNTSVAAPITVQNDVAVISGNIDAPADPATAQSLTVTAPEIIAQDVTVDSTKSTFTAE